MAATYAWGASNALLKTRFRKLVNTFYKDYPLLGMLKKKVVTFGGRTYNHTVQYSPGGHASATFANSQEHATDSSTVEFALYPKKMYGVKVFDGLFLANMKSSEESYITKMAELQKDALDMVNHSLASAIYGKYYGSIGKIASVATTSVLTLTVSTDAQRFIPGMRLLGDASETACAGTCVMVVTKVNRSSGTINITEVTQNPDANMYLFPEGSENLSLTGLSQWIPATAPTGSEATMFGATVDRSVDVENLAGCRLDGSAYTSREELLIDAASQVWQYTRGKVTHFVMNPKQLAALIKELGAKVQYSRVSAQGTSGPIAGVGFDGIKVYGAGGIVDVFADPWCPLNTCYGINVEEISILSCGGQELPAILEEDGNPILRVYNADAYEFRVGCYPVIVIDRPGCFTNVTMPTLT